MKQPTREELERVRRELWKIRAERVLGWELESLGAAIKLLDAYPLPPEDGERAEIGEQDVIAAGLLTLAAALQKESAGSAWALDLEYQRLTSTRVENLRRAAALLRQPPAVSSEREPIRRALAELDALHAATNEADKIYTEALRRNEREGTRRMTNEQFKRYAGSGDRYRAAKERYERAKAAHYPLLRAVAEELLRQPLHGGVSKAAVREAVEEIFRPFDSCLYCHRTRRGEHDHSCYAARLMAAVEALPDAAPRESPEDERERQRLADVVESIGKRGLSPWQEEDMKKASELLRRHWATP